MPKMATDEENEPSSLNRNTRNQNTAALSGLQSPKLENQIS
jgi:hypothetical protein